MEKIGIDQIYWQNNGGKLMKQQLTRLKGLKGSRRLVSLDNLRNLFRSTLLKAPFTFIKSSLLGAFLGCIGFITTAIAETDAKSGAASTSTTATTSQDGMSSSALSQGLMLAAFALIFYFLVLRPQSKRAKDHRSLVSNLQKGDEVLTSGGIVGKVSKITDDFIVLNISENNEILIQRQAIAALLPKGTMKSI